MTFSRLILGLATLMAILLLGQIALGQPGGLGRFGGRAPDVIRDMPVLTAIDSDKNGEISLAELNEGVKAVLRLDRNGDGDLSEGELSPATGGGAPRGGPDRGMSSMMLRMMPWMTALDGNKDGALSKQEIQQLPKALALLDKDENGKLTENELRPDMRDFFRRGGGGPGRQLAPEELKASDGAATIPDHATFQELSYKGQEVMIDTFLADLEFVKFTIDGPLSKEPKVYFINTVTHRAHMMFARIAGLPRGGSEQMKGVLVYRPRLKSPNGSPGLFTFEFEPFDAYPFDLVLTAQELLIEKMPSLKGKVGYYPRGRALDRYQDDKELYEDSAVTVYLDEDLTSADLAYLPLNPARSFGRLRLMDGDARPSPRDVVIYRSLPNEMPRVGGIITAVRQTPLSHVNLRAIQDDVPNAFVLHAAENERIKPLIGKQVFYRVTADGFELREATADEVETHFSKLRPAKPQSPPRDLTIKEIRPLDKLKFEDSSAVGVKAANLAAMRSFEFPTQTIPDGFAVPFYFYDEFMKYNGFYERVDSLLQDPEFQHDRDTREKKLKQLRKLIKDGKTPDWMMTHLQQVQQSFPEGTPIRCRSSTNNEDLPGFSGAGLYDSYSHHPHEGHLSKSIKQVYASLWNYRAFDEREFYRVDHKAAAMGVLMHPNFNDERVNGVAVTDDILYETAGNYYVNSQVGEDLVTNPEQESVPEEILLGWYKDDGHQVMRRSNRAPQDGLLLSEAQLDELRQRLARIHGRFRRLYGASEDDRFAMEIEFKITKDGLLAIKQARPWVFADNRED